MAEITDSLSIKPARGALIAGVDDKGPAKPAGIEPGDVIVKFDGKEIKEMRDLPKIVAETPVGKDVDRYDHPQGQGRNQDGPSSAGSRNRQEARFAFAEEGRKQEEKTAGEKSARPRPRRPHRRAAQKGAVF